MNGAAVVAEILKREGTGFLSCYPRNPLIEACAALDIRTILCRQERVGVGIADGYSRIKRGKRNGVFAVMTSKRPSTAPKRSSVVVPPPDHVATLSTWTATGGRWIGKRL